MSAAVSFRDDAEIDAFVARFLDRGLPKPEWTHHAHLVVGLWHLQRHGFDESLSLLRERIRAFNESTGVPNTDDSGYHETLTVFFLRALSVFAARECSRLEMFRALKSSRLQDKALVLAFYSRERINSPESRQHWMEPDLQSFAGLAELLVPTMTSPSFYIRQASRDDADDFIRLVVGLAEFEKLNPPDAAAQARLIEDAFGAKPRIEVWLAFADESRLPVGYAIFLETYSSFLARPTLYIEDVFVLETHRKRGIGGALLKKAVELAHQRECGRVEWTALDWNVNAQRVYEEKLGAKRMSEWFLYRMTRREMDAYLRGDRTDS